MSTQPGPAGRFFKRRTNRQGKKKHEKIKEKDKFNRLESEIDEDIYNDSVELTKDNYWIRKQVIVTFIAGMIHKWLRCNLGVVEE